MDCYTRSIFVVFSAIVMFLMHWNIRQLSGVNSDCILGHETTLTYLDDFKSSLLQSDLMVSFVDKSDLLDLQNEKKEARDKVALLTRQLKRARRDLVSKGTRYSFLNL